MIYTYTFNDIDKRNAFINIVKELGFKTNSHTYTKSMGSESIATESFLGNGKNIKTRHHSATLYEVNIEKEIDDIEENKLEKLKEFFFYNKYEFSFKILIFGGIFFGIILAFITAFILSDVLGIINFKNETVSQTTIVLSILIAMYYMYKHMKSSINNDKLKITELKQYLLKNYLGEKGKKIIEEVV